MDSSMQTNDLNHDPNQETYQLLDWMKEIWKNLQKLKLGTSKSRWSVYEDAQKEFEKDHRLCLVVKGLNPVHQNPVGIKVASAEDRSTAISQYINIKDIGESSGTMLIGTHPQQVQPNETTQPERNLVREQQNLRLSTNQEGNNSHQEEQGTKRKQPEEGDRNECETVRGLESEQARLQINQGTVALSEEPPKTPRRSCTGIVKSWEAP